MDKSLFLMEMMDDEPQFSDASIRMTEIDEALPSTPLPPNILTQGRLPTDEDTTVPLFVHLVSRDEVKAAAAAMQFAPMLARAWQTEVGNSMLRGEPEQFRQMRPLAPATLKKREYLRRKGVARFGDLPLMVRGVMAERFRDNYWHPTITQTGNEITIGLGPRLPTDDMGRPGGQMTTEEHRWLQDMLRGGKGLGPKRNTSVQAREPGMTQSVRMAVSRLFSSWIGSQLATQMGVDSSLADISARQLPNRSYWSAPNGFLAA